VCECRCVCEGMCVCECACVCIKLCLWLSSNGKGSRVIITSDHVFKTLAISFTLHCLYLSEIPYISHLSYESHQLTWCLCWEI